MSLLLVVACSLLVGAGTLAPRTADAEETHRVSWGETLWSIAQQYGVAVERIASANGVDNHDYVWAGQRLTIPGTVSASSNTGGASGEWHEVRAGESLSQIAERYGASVQAFVDANLLSDANFIYSGQRLMLPGGYTSDAPAPPATGGATPQAERISHELAGQYLADAEREFGIPAGLLRGLAYQESGWQSWVVSSAGAIGLTQVLPETGDWVVDTLLPGADDWATNPRNNARVGAAFLRYLLDITDWNTDLALAGYYQGLGNVRLYGWFSDTLSYVDNVLYFQDRYR